MSADTVEIRRAFSSFMTGVTVVTACSEDKLPVGFTANSFTSVSLQPPLLLVCPAKGLSSFPVFASCENFAVSVLAEDQRVIANTFANDKGDRFAGVDWQPDEAGSPIFAGAAATFSLRVHERVDAGDHVVMIGEVQAFQCADKPGLGYANGGYFSLGLERRAVDVPRSSQVTVGAVVSFEDKVLLVRSDEGWHPPQGLVTERPGPLAAIRQYLHTAGIDVEFGPVYSVFDQQGNGAVSIYYRATAGSPPDASFGELVAVDELSTLTYTDGAIENMMCRFALEYRQGVFGLYVGDEAQGDVHMFPGGEVQ